MAVNSVVIALVVSGVFFMAVSAIAMLRFPDFYTRSHAMGKADTLGLVLLMAGLGIYSWELSSLKLLFVMVFIMIANPTATHAIVKAALKSGLPIWTRKEAGSDGREGI